MSPLFVIRKLLVFFVLGVSIATVLPLVLMAAEFLYLWYDVKNVRDAYYESFVGQAIEFIVKAKPNEF